MKKRVLCLVLALILALGMLSACGSTDNGGTSDTKNPDSVGGNETGEKISITIGIPEKTNVESYDDNAYVKWLEEQTGYEIKFQLFAATSGDYSTQLSVQILNESSKLPDILMGFEGLSNATWRTYGEDGYFASLTDYFADRDGAAKDWYDRLEEIGLSQGDIDFILTGCSADDGEIYAFPTLEMTSVDTMDYAVQINQTWLDELNLDMPTDAVSLYEVLKAFKAAHPESIPLASYGDDFISGDGVNWLMNMFEYVDDSKWFNMSEDATTLWSPFVTDKYREGLIFCHKLYEEGLFSILATNAEVRGLVNLPDEDMKIGCLVGHPSVAFEIGHESIYNYTAVPIWGYAVRKADAIRYETYITESAAEDGKVDACWNLLMTMCSEESAYRQRYGVKGTNWVEADEGAKSFLGLDAEVNVINDCLTSLGSENLKKIVATILNNAESETVQVDENTDAWSKHKYDIQAAQYEYFTAAEAKNPKNLLQPIALRQDEADLTQNERSNTQSWIRQYRLGFIMGSDGLDPSDDADWNAYLKGLEDNGLSVWQEQLQRLYDSGKTVLIKN